MYKKFYVQKLSDYKMSIQKSNLNVLYTISNI